MRSKLFQTAVIRKPSRNTFDLSHEKKLSFQIGQLIPTYLQEVYPGDSFRVRQEILARFQPLIAALMHRVDITTHFFFVPNRLNHADWEDFITGGSDGLQAPVLPFLLLDNTNEEHFAKGELSDYLGIPPITNAITQDIQIQALPFSAYWSIYNEYYRDQNVQAAVAIDLDNGDVTQNYEDHSAILQRSYEKDYFTSCLPWAQRGNPVTLDITLVGGVQMGIGAGGATPAVAGAIGSTNANTYVYDDLGGTPAIMQWTEDAATQAAELEIIELRRVVKLQEWLEKNAIAGGRYEEQMLAHFGVIGADARFQKPEYLGGGKSPMVISEVLNTGESLVPSDDTLSQPTGAMAGHGISVGSTKAFTKSFKEHGFIMGITSVLPRTSYQEGIERMWRYDDKTDYYWPEYAHLGEQAVLQSEIFFDETGTDMDDTFGYQARYAHLKFAQDSVHGDFRDEFTDWHMTRILGSAPTLNTAFMLCDSADHDRNFAVTAAAEHKIFAQIYNDVQAIRPMPVYGTPGL